MGWEFYAPLILKYGIEGAFQIAQIFAEHGDPTPEAWAKLRALGLKPESDYIREAMLRAGLTTLPPWVLPPDPPAPGLGSVTIGWPVATGPTAGGT